MKIKEGNAGALTNFEVLDFLRSRGASKDPTRVIVPVADSEFKVYDYLVGSAACNQTREHIHEFFRRCTKFKLAKAEMLNLVNIRPASIAEAAAIIETCLVSAERLNEDDLGELVELILEVLPEPPQQQTLKGSGDEGGEGTGDTNNEGDGGEGAADTKDEGNGEEEGTAEMQE